MLLHVTLNTFELQIKRVDNQLQVFGYIKRFEWRKEKENNKDQRKNKLKQINDINS